MEKIGAYILAGLLWQLAVCSFLTYRGTFLMAWTMAARQFWVYVCIYALSLLPVPESLFQKFAFMNLR